jgi:serine/threonine-protein kinase
MQSVPPHVPGEPADMPVLPPGSEIASYRIEDVIAVGGMSIIYRATHTALDRAVALKILSGELARDETTRARFMTEVRVTGQMKHPNIVEVHDAGEVDGQLFLAMELVPGGDLGGLIERHGAVPPKVAVRLLAQAGSALDAAHAAGVVHRDVKPANLLLDGDRCKLTDFGLTKLLRSDAKLTAPGRIAGTANYLAPEQIRGEAVDPRTDVYALGCVMFETLTGSTPFDAESDFVLMYAHMDSPIPKATERHLGLPKGVDDVIARAMAKAPADRYASAGEAITALRGWLG